MQTYTVEKQIQMPFQNVEGMLLKDGMVYVCCWDTACNKLYQIDPNTDVLADSIKLAGAAPQSVVQDKEQKLWVMGGNAPKNKNTTMTRIDLVTKTVIQKYTFAAGVEAIKPCLNPNKDSIYFIEVNYSGAASNNGIYRMPIEAKFLPNEPFISCVVNQYFWALGIDGKSGNIYVGDPKGFVQKGGVSIYSPQANLLHQFNVGLGVSSFYFD
jgi:DNA-binding beta-propeller fold protein YncE